jgi:glycosyltransferase involved in cell wall biosynthesis
MTKANIAVLNAIAQLGGAEISLLELLHRSGEHFQFHLILPEDGPLKKKAEHAGARVWEIRWPKKLMQLGERNKGYKLVKMLQAVTSISPLTKEISHLLRDIRADLLITNGIKCHIVGAVSHKRYRIPLVWYLRDGLEGRRLSSLALSFYASRCSGAIAISNFIAGDARKVLPKTVPVHVLYNIIDLKKFEPNSPAPSDLKKNDGEIWYGMIGALTVLKGQDLLLDAAEQVLESIPNARFIIVGINFYKTEASLHYEEQLRLKAEFYPLKDRVIFLGFRDDIPAVLSTLDVLVQPNRGPEGLGRSIIEAMACGVPVIAVNRWGPAELIQDCQTGMLFPWMDIESLSEKMVRLGKDPELRKKLGSDGMRWVRKNLVPEKIADEFVNVLNGILSEDKRA